MIGYLMRPLVGLLSIGVAVGLVVFAVTSFRGGFQDTVPVTVLSQRAGLVMYPDAAVKMRGVAVGKVESIEERPDGLAAIHLAIDAGQRRMIPANVSVDIASTTVFGAKFVQLIPPDTPAPNSIAAGQVFEAGHVTVEINTVFQQLTSVLAHIDPEKLNETLGAVAAATNGRGQQVGQMLSDLEAFLAKLEPGLPALRDDLAQAPAVLNTYAGAAPALLDTAGNAARISQTLVDEQKNLDGLLVGLIGLSDTGTPVLADNHSALAKSLRLLVPTTSLTSAYHDALTCSVNGFARLAELPDYPAPGVAVSASFLWGTDPYEYPKNLPKVAAKGGPQCFMLPVPYEGRPPFVVTDVGANPFEKDRQSVTLNVNTLPQALFGPAPVANGGPR
jgi:virulence factor Mce-like protein